MQAEMDLLLEATITGTGTASGTGTATGMGMGMVQGVAGLAVSIQSDPVQAQIMGRCRNL